MHICVRAFCCRASSNINEEYFLKVLYRFVTLFKAILFMQKAYNSQTLFSLSLNVLPFH